MVVAREKNREEAKSDYVAKMGAELGTQFYRLWEEFLWLGMKWAEYTTLFDARPNRLDLLNKAAPTFFWMVEIVFWEGILLDIARLTDPPLSMGKKNLTIQNLPGLVEDPEIKTVLEKLVNIANTKVEFCRDWRNRRIAHNDLDLAINIEPARPLDAADKEKVADALIAIRNVLMELERRYMVEDSVFMGIPIFHGASDLLSVLYFGFKEQTRANQRIQAGQATEDDYPALKL